MTQATMPVIEAEERPAAKGKKPVTFVRIGANAIMNTYFEPVKWVVPGYLPEGFSVLAGRQKLGKTWLALDIAAAVAVGGYAMGAIECTLGNVLYIDLENGTRRVQRRVETLFPNERTRPDLSRLEFVSDAPRLNAGFIDACEDWRLNVPLPRLIVIDVLQRVKSAGVATKNAYENDYAIFEGLQKWATSKSIAVLGLHHTKKGGADDPLEALSGSNGLSAVADTTLVLDRDGNGITLYVRGRDVEERETALKFDAGLWTMLGNAADVRRSDERVTIAVTLKEASEPMSPKDIAIVTGMKDGNVRKLLHTMVKAGEAMKSGRGAYFHPERVSEFGFSKTPGNNGNNHNRGAQSDDD